MSKVTVGLVASLVLVVSACDAEEPEPAPPVELSSETQEVQFDWCAFLGWYGDGQCQWYCPQVDPDCVPDDHCGGFTSVECGSTEWCDFPPGGACGAADESGECKPRPQFCTAQYDPVCGCDGQTYGNVCEARRNGTDVSSAGECEPPPVDHCGGFTAEQCAANEWCDFPADASCGFADETGECKPRPQLCTTQYDPVCGCNGMTYSNACNAHSAGTDVIADGPCEEPPGPSCAGHCGNQSDGDCWCDQQCAYYGDCCADVQDVCGWSP